MLLNEICITEAREPYQIKEKNKFKKGFKKHKHNKKVIKQLKIIKSYFAKGELPPNTPPFKNHKLTDMGGLYDVHVDGNQIIMTYTIDGNIINLEGLGSHRELGVQ